MQGRIGDLIKAGIEILWQARCARLFPGAVKCAGIGAAAGSVFWPETKAARDRLLFAPAQRLLRVFQPGQPFRCGDVGNRWQACRVGKYAAIPMRQQRAQWHATHPAAQAAHLYPIVIARCMRAQQAARAIHAQLCVNRLLRAGAADMAAQQDFKTGLGRADLVVLPDHFFLQEIGQQAGLYLFQSQFLHAAAHWLPPQRRLLFGWQQAAIGQLKTGFHQHQRRIMAMGIDFRLRQRGKRGAIVQLKPHR